jgi:hypothetical protein
VYLSLLFLPVGLLAPAAFYFEAIRLYWYYCSCKLGGKLGGKLVKDDLLSRGDTPALEPVLVRIYSNQYWFLALLRRII